jgi:hypothetical protein
MDFWNVMSYLAWIISGALLFWIVFDAIKVSKEYDEDYLLSSREGEDLLLDEEKGNG